MTCEVLFVTAELAPVSKVGGLGEVAAGLTRELRRRGTDVHLLTPLHARVRPHVDGFAESEEITVDFGGAARTLRLLSGHLPGSDVPVHFLVAPDFFEVEDDPYGCERGPTGLGHLRWLLFSAAVRPASRALGLDPRVLHVNDWHTALVPALYRTDHHFDDDAAATACVLTVHNAAFQGRLSIDDYRASGLRDDVLSEWHLLHEGEVNLLKGGVVFAECVTTVSPRYAREIQTATAGEGLEHVFEARFADLSGIANGVDTTVWDPAADDVIEATFDADDTGGKARCRDALLRELGLEPTTGPVLAMVGRLTPQKGVDLLIAALPELLRRRRVRLVVLGCGDRELESGIERAAQRHLGRVAAAVRFDDALAHRIEAGADIFLMPSLFEPCGLNQMISQRYGTIPVVRLTGGLADTVVPYDGTNAESATGFGFEAASAEALVAAVRRAIDVFGRPRTWRRLMSNAMRAPCGWDARARPYLDVYAKAAAMRAEREREEGLLAHLRLEPDQPYIAEHRSIPAYFEKDRLVLLPKDPRCVWASWEVQGKRGRAVLDGLTPEQRYGSRWELRLINVDTEASWVLPVEGLAKNWFVSVDPHHRYRAELWLTADGIEPICLLTSNETRTPPEAGA